MTRRDPMAAAVGKRIKDWREARQWTQEELAKKAGLPDATAISRIESGEHTPRLERLRRVLKALGKTWVELFEGIELRRGRRSEARA